MVERFPRTAAPTGSADSRQNWVGFVVLAAWGVVPLLFGYVRFQRMDI